MPGATHGLSLFQSAGSSVGVVDGREGLFRPYAFSRATSATLRKSSTGLSKLGYHRVRQTIVVVQFPTTHLDTDLGAWHIRWLQPPLPIPERGFISHRPNRDCRLWQGAMCPRQRIIGRALDLIHCLGEAQLSQGSSNYRCCTTLYSP